MNNTSKSIAEHVLHIRQYINANYNIERECRQHLVVLTEDSLKEMTLDDFGTYNALFEGVFMGFTVLSCVSEEDAMILLLKFGVRYVNMDDIYKSSH